MDDHQWQQKTMGPVHQHPGPPQQQRSCETHLFGIEAISKHRGFYLSLIWRWLISGHPPDANCAYEWYVGGVQKITLPKTNSSPLKIGPQTPQKEISWINSLLVSGRVNKSNINPKFETSLSTTHPKLHIALKKGDWKTTFLLGRPIFRGYVKLREGTAVTAAT